MKLLFEEYRHAGADEMFVKSLPTRAGLSTACVCMYVRMCAYACMYVYIADKGWVVHCMCVYVCTYVCVRMHVCMYISPTRAGLSTVCVYCYVCTYACMYILIVCMYMLAFVCACGVNMIADVRVCMYACMRA